MTEIIITSSVLILVIAALRRLLRGRFPLRLQYALWALVAVRLLVPVSFAGSAFSVLNAAPAVELPDRGNIYLSDEGITAYQPPPRVEYANASAGAAGESNRYELYYPPNSDDGTRVPVGEAPPEGYTTVPASRILPTPKAVLTVIWYIGMAAMGGWFLWVNLSFRKRLRAAARKVELPDCTLPVYVAEGLPSPCVFGLLRPAIYVTPACLEDEARLRHVLAHEETHVRHGDQLWSAVRCVCLTVYWFHPLAWLAAALSRRDCELACDEGTLKRLGEEERTAYGRTLISLMAESASPSYLLQTATTMVDRKRGIRERLLLIAKRPMTAAIATVAVVLIVAVAAACTFTGAAKRSNGYATVEEALTDVPEELLQPEEDLLSGITAYTPEERFEAFLEGMVGVTLEEGELFRGYWTFYIGVSSNLEDPLGWMASVYRMDQSGYDALTEARGMTGRRPDSYWECFAKDSESYYLIYAPITAPEMKTGETKGAQLQAELITWIKEAMLNVQGVTAFNGERLEYARQDGPLDLPAGPTGGDDPPAAAFTGTAEEAFQALLNGDTSLLADGAEEDAWRSWLEYSRPAELDYFLLDVDSDGVPELLVQYPDSPASLNGVFDFRDGVISCWRFDIMDGSEFQYPLMDGTMVFENHFSGAYSFRLFRYTPDGEQEDLNSLAYTPAGGRFGDSGEPASWQVDGQAVSEEEFDRALKERITSQRVAGGRGIPVPDLAACRDDLLMDFLLNVADGAYAEGAQYELGERFLARPGDILSTMTRYRGAEATRWPDRGGDGADWLVSALVCEFFYGDHHEVWEQFVHILFQFDREDCGGMAGDVQRWYLETFVQESEPNGQP